MLRCIFKLSFLLLIGICFLGGCESMEQRHSRLGDYLSYRREYEKAIDEYSKAIAIDSKMVQAYRGRGVTYYRKGQYEDAVLDFNRALAIDPKFADAYNNRGNVFFSKGQYDQAIVDYTKAIDRNPKIAMAYYNRAETHNRKNQYDEAIVDFGKAIEIDSKLTDAYVGRGESFRRKGDYNQSLNNFSKAIEMDNKNAAAYFWRGVAYAEMENYDLAISDFNQTLERDPKYLSAYLTKASMCEAAGRTREADEAYKGFIQNAAAKDTRLSVVNEFINENNLGFYKLINNTQQNPGDPQKHLELGYIFLKRYNQSYFKLYLTAAIKEFTNAINLKNDVGIAHCLLSSLLTMDAINKGNEQLIEKAIKESKECLSLKPEMAQTDYLTDFHFAIASAYLYLAEFKKDEKYLEYALREIKETVRFNPSRADSHKILGKIYHMKGQNELAVNELTESLKLKSDDSEAHKLLADVYFEKFHGDLDEASLQNGIMEYKEVIRLTPDNADAHKKLGWLYASKGLYDLDVFEAKEALRLIDNAENHKDYGDSLSLNGDYAQARKEYEAALMLNPDYADAHESMSLTFFLENKFDESIQEMNKYIELAKSHDVYSVLRHNFALVHIGKFNEAQIILQKFTADFAGDGWEAYLLKYYQNKITEAELFSKASHKGEQCEAFFYVGYNYFLKGDKQKTLEYLKKAVATKAFGFTEFIIARTMLEGLQKN